MRRKLPSPTRGFRIDIKRPSRAAAKLGLGAAGPKIGVLRVERAPRGFSAVGHCASPGLLRKPRYATVNVAARLRQARSAADLGPGRCARLHLSRSEQGPAKAVWGSECNDNFPATQIYR